MKGTHYLILWYVLLIGIFLYGKSVYNTPKYENIPVGPHVVFGWFGGEARTALIGNGEEIYLESTGSNFNVLDENGFFVTTGLPEPLKPGDTKETYTSSFKAEKDKKYYLNSDAKVYTLEPTTLKFEFVVFGGIVTSVVAAVLLIITSLIWLDTLIKS